jgi:membrane protease YdiL (CAAX protease family)
MNVVKIHHRMMIFLTAALALTCIISPWMAIGADWFAAEWPRLLSERVPFDKIFNRAFLIAGIILFIGWRRTLVPRELRSLLSPGLRIAYRNFLTGWGLAVLSMVLLVTAMAATDVFRPYIRATLSTGLTRFAGAFVASMFASFFEEVFFRGMLFLGLRETGHPVRAYILANLFYSAIHFVKPGNQYFLESVDVLAGFRHLLTTFEPFLDPLPLLPGIFALFLIGVVLSYALERSGNLYLSMGLHAGWILSLKILKVFGNFSRADLGWVFGSADPKIVSGVATWLGILLVGVAVNRITRQISPLSNDQPHATAA